MSEKNFSNKDDYASEVENREEEVYKPKLVKKEPKKGSVSKGIGVGLLLTLILELIVGYTLDVQNNLLHRYLAYMLGIVVIFVMVIFTKSVLRMFFLAVPIVTGFSFVLPFLYGEGIIPIKFSALMGPFLTIIPVVKAILASMKSLGIDFSSYQVYTDLGLRFGFILDFVIALFIGSIAAIGLTSGVKLLTKKPNILSIFSLIFFAVFFIIGVILLPYLIVVFSGITHFGLAFGAGGLALKDGIAISVDPNGSIDQANVYFSNAEKWFQQAENMLNGLGGMGLFGFSEKAVPNLQPLIYNGILFMEASVNLAKSIAPTMLGVAYLQQGITTSMDSLQSTATLALSLSQLSSDKVTQFENGLDTMRKGFASIAESFNTIHLSLIQIQSIDKAALINSLQNRGITNISSIIDLIISASILLDKTLNVLKVLITDYDTNNSTIGIPFIHLLKGTFAMNGASTKIGNNSNFVGTETNFQQVVGNLTIVKQSLQNPAFKDFETADLGNDQTILDLRDNLDGIFKFVKDASSISIAVGEFGITANPVLKQLNTSLSIFTDPQYDVNHDSNTNFTEIPDTVYDNNIANLTLLYPKAELMNVNGQQAEYLISQMETKSTNGTYGFMSSASNDFLNQFKAFNLVENANNIYYLTGGLIGVLKMSKQMKHVYSTFSIVKSDINFIKTLDINGSSFAVISQIQDSLVNINANLTIIDSDLNVTKLYIADAVGNFTQASSTMPQMQTSATKLVNISNDISDIQCYDNGTVKHGICVVKATTNETTLLVNPPDSINTGLNIIDGEFSYLEAKFLNINNELQGVSVNS